MRPRRILADFVIFAKGYIRGRIGLFFALVFPILLMALFGFIFAGNGPTTVPVYVQNLDGNSPTSESFLSALNHSGALQVNLVAPSAGNLSAYLAKNQYSAGIVVPSGFDASYRNHTPVNVTVYVNPQDPVTSGVVEGTVQGILNGFNLRAVNGSAIVGAQSYNVGSKSYRYVDYLVPGLIGFAILTNPMFAMTELTSTYKKEKRFNQLSLTPLTKAEWLSSKILWYTVLTLVSAVEMVAVGSFAFHAHVTLTWSIVPFLLLGPFLFSSLGMLAGSLSPNPEAAVIVGNVISFPMMFLAGTFFPVSGFSPALQLVARALPLYYVIDGMNAVMLFGNVGRALGDAIVVLVLSAAIFAVTVLVFRWRQE